VSGEGNSKMSEPRVLAVLDALQRGCTRRAAAGAADINSATFYRWLEDAAFRDAVEKAEAQAEAAYTMSVAAAVPKSWQAAAWWLERRRNEDYARREKVEMSIDIRAEAEKVAERLGLRPEDVIAEAEAILAGER
jgi:hypothetical protein